MNKTKLKPLESESSLPAIKKNKSTVGSPRIANLSPVPTMMSSLSPTPRELNSVKIPNELIVTGLEDVIKKRAKISKLNFHKKIANLIKIIEEQENYIRTLETEFNVNKNDFTGKKLKNNNKSTLNNSDSKIENESVVGKNSEDLDSEENFEKFLNDDTSKNKYKDQEIYKLRKQIEDNQKAITKLAMENSSIKKRTHDFDGIIEKSTKITQEVEAVKSFCKEELKSMQNKLNEKEIELNSKDVDIQDLAELLKRSEEKRNYSQEYNSFMENNSAKLKDKLASLNHEKMKLEQELEELKKKIEEKEALAEELKKKLDQLESHLEFEKMKNSTLSYNYEVVKEGLKASNEKNDLQKMKHRVEREKLMTTVDSHKHERPKPKEEPTKRRVTIVEQSTISGITKEEASRWQERYTAIQVELQKTQEDIEKLNRTEVYLKNQLITKELMISQIESLMKMNEEPDDRLDERPETKLSSDSTVAARNIAELLTLIEEMKYRFKSSEEVVKCVACFKIPNECFLAHPCGHMSCLSCKSEFEVLCPQCSNKINALVHAEGLGKIIQHFRKETENLEKVKKILEHQQF